MKISKYNNFVNYQSKIVGYNALSNSFILLEDDLYELYKAAKNENSIEEFEKIHPEFYKFMISKGFFVQKDKDELKEAIALSREIDNDDSFFDLFINPTMNCNFKCWYCYETHISNSKMSITLIENVIKFVHNIIKENSNLKTFYLSWFGGEPLLQYKDVVLPLLKQICEICDDNKIKFNSGFTTNGLILNQNMIDNFKKYKVDQLQITLDGIKPLHDKIRYISKNKGSYDKIIQNIILLAKNQIEVIVRINCTEETLKGIDSIMESFTRLDKSTKKFINFTFHRVWQIEDSLDDSVSHYIDKYNGKDFSVTGVALDAFRDSCYADKKNQALINYDGNVFKCSARDFVPKNKDGILSDDGKIVWNEKFDKRMNSKFNNKPCRECSVLPLCGGGCTQIAMEKENKEYCVYDFDETKKEKLVLDTFLTRVSK